MCDQTKDMPNLVFDWVIRSILLRWLLDLSLFLPIFAGPDLLIERNFHSAGVITDTVNKEKRVMVVGGKQTWADSDSLDSVEWLIKEKWEQGKPKHDYYYQT